MYTLQDVEKTENRPTPTFTCLLMFLLQYKRSDRKSRPDRVAHKITHSHDGPRDWTDQVPVPYELVSPIHRTKRECYDPASQK